jgi:hypothetical protein
MSPEVNKKRVLKKKMKNTGYAAKVSTIDPNPRVPSIT